MELVKQWLKDCMTNHLECKQQRGNWWPTRLLKVENEDAYSIRLVHTEEEPVNEQYLTLSHCWGHTEFFKLTAGTSMLLKAGITLDMLPRTFQDAAKMTAFLGVQYLWIDSLCIFQDSVDDWRNESAMMGNIYWNGLCNIAATGSANGNGGLHFERPGTFNMPCLVETSWDDSANKVCHVHPESIGRLLEGPLLHRGWVIQERVLALRTIHFGSRQLFWECHHHQACETYPRGMLPILSGRKGGLMTYESLRHVFNSADTTSRTVSKEVLKCWDEIVEGFSRCNLTREEDKLVALSGIAKMIQSRFLDCFYIAGLWKQSLHTNLLWFVSEDRQTNGLPTSRPKQYRAPSWSWASVEGIIETFSISPGESQADFNILSVDIETIGPDNTGQVTSGLMRVAGNLLTISTKERHGLQQPTLINGVWFSMWQFGFSPDVDEPHQNLHCLPLRKGKQDGKQILCCLLLQPTFVKTGQFTRFGRIWIDCGDWGIGDLTDVQNEEWIEFEERDDNGRYIISIV
jgi:hypothetical protein